VTRALPYDRVPVRGVSGRAVPFWLCLLVALMLSSCGYVGDPLPPALNIPERITDLRAVQRGDRILIDFTPPALTTEGLPVRKGGTIELRIGTAEQPFSVDAWAATAQTVEMQAAAHAEAPAGPWYGRTVVVGVRVVTDQGRTSEWSNLLTLAVAQGLATPSNVRAVPHAKGVQVSWQSPPRDNVQFRVLRRSDDEKQPALVGTASGTEYIDAAVVLGKRYEYTVQAISGTSESDVAAAAAVTVADVSAPAAPTGLTVVPSLDSIALGWEGNAEPDLAHYRVYRAEAEGMLSLIAEKVETPAFSDKQIMSGKVYRYAVTAVDAAGNESEKTAPVQVTAP
jgi:hypothetical protein